MGFMDSLQNFVRIITGDDEEEEYYENTPPVASVPRDIYATASTASTAPDYAAYYENLPVQQPAPEPEPVPDPVVDTIALLRPESLESVRDAADHLVQNHAIILSLKHTDAALARRWMDYLSGTTYTLGGKMNRIAAYTYLFTPEKVELVAGFDGGKTESDKSDKTEK